MALTQMENEITNDWFSQTCAWRVIYIERSNLVGRSARRGETKPPGNNNAQLSQYFRKKTLFLKASMRFLELWESHVWTHFVVCVWGMSPSMNQLPFREKTLTMLVLIVWELSRCSRVWSFLFKVFAFSWYMSWTTHSVRDDHNAFRWKWCM